MQVTPTRGNVLCEFAPFRDVGDTPPVRAADDDDALRAAAFAFLSDLSARTGGIVSRADLRQFTFGGQRISLEQNMRGIRVVRGYPAALSILTTYRERPEDRPTLRRQHGPGWIPALQVARERSRRAG